MWFPDICFYGVGDPTTTVLQRNAALANVGKHFIKYAVNYSYRFIYPLAEHEIFAAWILDMIERQSTLSQSNFCIQHNQDLRHSIVQELATHIHNNGSEAHGLHIYKYTSNFTGSYPYWFQRRWELTAQVKQEGLQCTIFWTFSAKDNHFIPINDLVRFTIGCYDLS